MELLACACWSLLPLPDPPDPCLARLDGFPPKGFAEAEAGRWRRWEKRLQRLRERLPAREVDARQEKCRECARAWDTLAIAREHRRLWDGWQRRLKDPREARLAEGDRLCCLRAMERLRGLIGADAFDARKMPLP